MKYCAFFILIFMVSNCKSQSKQNHINIDGQSIEERIQCPASYKRDVLRPQSFQDYLRNLKLKAHGSLVHYYNGSTKSNDNIYAAVVDLPIGDKNLHQCADAIMRLKAEHLWKEKQYDEIHFNFTNGCRVDYSEYIKGNRMVIQGNKTNWKLSQKPSNTYADFWNYLELIFMYAGTASLEQEMKSIHLEDLTAGDVLIKGGHPGHAVIVVDEAVHVQTGDKIFLLAQSYMPAQEIQILQNPNNYLVGPWYKLEEVLYTPEWTFTQNQIKRFN